MLKPALLYAQEITRKFTEHLYTTDYFYYCGYCCGSSLPKIEENDDLYQFAIVDSDDNVIGFLTYRISDYSDTVQSFGLFSFDKGNPLLGRDVFLNSVSVITVIFTIGTRLQKTNAATI